MSMIAARDPTVFVRWCLEKFPRKDEKRESLVVASETCAFDLIEAEFIRDVEPGEIVTSVRTE